MALVSGTRKNDPESYNEQLEMSAASHQYNFNSAIRVEHARFRKLRDTILWVGIAASLALPILTLIIAITIL